MFFCEFWKFIKNICEWLLLKIGNISFFHSFVSAKKVLETISINLQGDSYDEVSFSIKLVASNLQLC